MQLVSHFVPPPLPYVGMETSSFAEDAKEWRGDVDVKGRWKDRDTLRLVSSRFRVSCHWCIDLRSTLGCELTRL